MASVAVGQNLENAFLLPFPPPPRQNPTLPLFSFGAYGSLGYFFIFIPPPCIDSSTLQNAIQTMTPWHQPFFF